MRVVGELHSAIEAVYNDHGDERAAEACRQGRADAEVEIAAARDDGFRAGAISVMKRSDFREVGFTADPMDLRSIH